MTPQNESLPQAGGRLFLTYVGMETDLIFNQGIDLPGFASFPLLETEDGRQRLHGYCTDMISLARAHDLGVILESPTWMANRDRGAAIGYDPQTLAQRNRQGIALMADARAGEDSVPIIISANIGPRSDAYAPGVQMTAEEAEHYHAEQIGILSETKADVISAYTLAYPEEAIGIVRAAQRLQLPVIISFTVETDGCLPTGMPIGKAIEAVDTATAGYAAYFMINCAHPDHFAGTLTGQAWMKRLRGVVANASRCSHAELDDAEVLDDGNPMELGQQLAKIHRNHPAIAVLGGCCGTDLRHMTQIAQAVAEG